jgi:hypothetical protein
MTTKIEFCMGRVTFTARGDIAQFAMEPSIMVEIATTPA